MIYNAGLYKVHTGTSVRGGDNNALAIFSASL